MPSSRYFCSRASSSGFVMMSSIAAPSPLSCMLILSRSGVFGSCVVVASVTDSSRIGGGDSRCASSSLR